MIKVLHPGFYTTVQDYGRTEFQEYGVPISGVMDKYSASIANALVGNSGNAAVLEITMLGPNLEFQESTLISITGAHLSPRINDASIRMNSAVKVSQGDVLTFGKLRYGLRAYVAISGGFLTQEVLKSRSMYLDVTKYNRINKNDVLRISTSHQVEHHNTGVKVDMAYFNDKVLKVYQGPEFGKLSEMQKEILLTEVYTIANENSRMAYQLEETLENNLKPIITSLVLPGTVQLTPSGKLIILMRDCQTTGGYPRVLQLTEESINHLAQKFSGNQIKLKRVD